MRSCARKIPFIVLAILGVGCCSAPVLALSYSQAVDVSFTFNPTLSISLSSADLVISELVPGSIADSNTIDINVSTNTAFGYTLSANVGNATSYNTRNLIRSDLGNSFASVAIDSSLDSLSTDNTWGFSYKPSSDSAPWASYSGLPLYSDTENTKTLVDTNSPLDAQSIQFKIAAKAASTMPAGEYRNVINFIAVAKPEPTPAPIQCEENKICYSNNALDNVEGTMGKQPNATSGSTVTLLASNYSRQGFGFAGWNTAPDYSGTNYGPNEDVTMPADMSHGLPLYAMWVKSSGVMQGWNGCIGLNIGDVTALTDARDNDTYAVAKLADGKCWMIENLRLDNTADHNADGTLSQGYDSSFIGLAEPEVANFSDSTTANSLYTTETGIAGKNTISGSNQGYRFPRYNNINTPTNPEDRSTNPISNSFTNDATTPGMYSYGGYYTWAAAIADITNYTTNNQNVTTSSICPSGWVLPSGGDKGNEANSDYWDLIVNGINNQVKPANYGSTTTPYYTGTSEGRNISKALRAYPNNYIYSGNFYGSSAYNRGSYGLYWVSTADSSSHSYNLLLGSSLIYPGTYEYYKSSGRTIRCISGS